MDGFQQEKDKVEKLNLRLEDFDLWRVMVFDRLKLLPLLR